MYDITKRTIDIVGSITLLVLFSPLLLLIAILIKLTSKGPILATTPKRVGKGGKLFHAYKFRSMIDNAHQLQYKDPKYKKVLKEKVSGGYYKVKNDPRITSIGRFIRKHSIDEVPQLVNVLKGEMSIVGPRPCFPEELESQQKKFPGTKEYVTEMLKVRPGITGYWQVTGRSNVKFDKRSQMEAYYAKKRSILLDLLVLLKTPWVMITGKGAA
jgi:lipopolysaccharide/colanic/teichoic acid biosynthesis glycosyltransferase